MTEIVLTYAGTMLIGFEFVRKLNRLELMLVLIATWPISPLINAFPTTARQREQFKWHNIVESFSLLKTIYAIILLPFLIPLSLISLLAYIFTVLINTIDELLNLLWKLLITRYEKASRKFVGILIERIKRYRGLSSKGVVREMKNRKIPFLPVIGIILITIALIMYIF
jgi:hypothetical protein